LDLPELDINMVKYAVAEQFDNQIANLRVQITKIQEKKQQLLALGHE
jgi:hypothetical protein